MTSLLPSFSAAQRAVFAWLVCAVLAFPVAAQTSDLRLRVGTLVPKNSLYHRELMDRGATIAFDLWGDDFDYGDVAMPTDAQRVEATAQLIEQGYGDRIVHSPDVCTKTQLLRYGGAGYAHIPRHVGRMLEAAGLSSDECHRQLAGNALALINPEGASQ